MTAYEPVAEASHRRMFTEMFARAESIEEAVAMAVGAASVCWDNPAGAGVFDSSRAAVLATALYEHIQAQAQGGDKVETRTEWAVWWGADDPNDVEEFPTDFGYAKPGRLNLGADEDRARHWVARPNLRRPWRLALREVPAPSPWRPVSGEEGSDG